MSQAELRVVEGEGAPPAGPQDKLVGTTIDGRYEVERVLGEGGMGLVYKARHIVLNKPLALKVLRPDVSRDEEIISRFRQEAQSASAIGNQHIIDISDFGVLPDGSTYFIMEFLDGIDLTGAIEQAAQLEPARVVHIAKQLCMALGAAHESGIVHRDLKPDNIYLIKRGGDANFVKVLDFGIAKVGGNSSKLTRAGQVFGTPHYMSPEQCAGSGVDQRTDVYALGIILYEMTTGEVPFDADNLMGILTKHLYEEPIAPRQRNPDIPEEFELVILKAMAKDKEVRYGSMYELLEDLKRLEQGVGTVARETTTSIPLDTMSGVPSKSRAPMFMALGVLLLGLVGGGAYLALKPPPPPIVQTPPPQPEVEDPIIEPIVVEEAQQAAIPPPADVKVRIVSEPMAEVWRGNEIIGPTPVEIDRPRDAERLELELRAEGFQTRSFAISALTSEEISFHLEPVAVRSTSRMGRPSRMSMTEAMVETMAETPMVEMEAPPRMTMTGMQTASEVLDPWAGE